MIAAGIETTYIKIPMIIRQYQHIGFNQLSLTPPKAMQ